MFQHVSLSLFFLHSQSTFSLPIAVSLSFSISYSVYLFSLLLLHSICINLFILLISYPSTSLFLYPSINFPIYMSLRFSTCLSNHLQGISPSSQFLVCHLLFFALFALHTRSWHFALLLSARVLPDGFLHMCVCVCISERYLLPLPSPVSSNSPTFSHTSLSALDACKHMQRICSVAVSD